MLGFLFRVAEQQPSMVSEELNDYSYINSVWICFITMSTVGYGELSPVSISGKAVAVICAFSGVILQAGMIISLYRIIKMSPSESASYFLLQALELKEKVKLHSIYIFQLMYKWK